MSDSSRGPLVDVNRRNGLAVASLVVGIAGVSIVLTLSGVTGLVALVLGIIARRRISKTNQSGAGFALAGIILGVVGVVLGVILTIVGLALFGAAQG